MEAATEEEEVQAEANADNDDDASHLLLCGLMTLPKLRLSLCFPSLTLTLTQAHTQSRTVVAPLPSYDAAVGAAPCGRA